MVDVNNAASGGPFSPERAGRLPLIEMLDYMKERGVDDRADEAHHPPRRAGSRPTWERTTSAPSRERAQGGDARAREVVEAMAYQIAKEIAGDGVGAAGGGWTPSSTRARWRTPTTWSGSSTIGVSFIADKMVLPGENELESLAMGALEVLSGRGGTRGRTPGG